MDQRRLTVTPVQLQQWVAAALPHTKTGQLPMYVPHLSSVNPNWFAVQVQPIAGEAIAIGNTTQAFPLMSVIKPFVLLWALEHWGAKTVFSLVGTQPSDQPFYSLEQLRADQGFPRNPMLNSGAIALVSQIPGKTPSDRCELIRRWLNERAQSSLVLDATILASVQSRPNDRNRALAQELEYSGRLGTSAAIALDTYERLCCLAATVADLAKLGMVLVQPQQAIAPLHQQRVAALMLTCGLYEYSGQFAVEVGLPTKSGVSGAVLSIVPREGAIACFSPPLDAIGNSIGGLYLLKTLSQALNLSVFH